MRCCPRAGVLTSLCVVPSGLSGVPKPLNKVCLNVDIQNSVNVCFLFLKKVQFWIVRAKPQRRYRRVWRENSWMQTRCNVWWNLIGKRCCLDLSRISPEQYRLNSAQLDDSATGRETATKRAIPISVAAIRTSATIPMISCDSRQWSEGHWVASGRRPQQQ